VKLVCLDCKRENFGSTQGFINHCRIAHRREFKSHEEAAAQSGHPIELDEVGGIVGEEKHTVSATGLVHPLIRTAPTDKDAYAALLSRIATSLNMYYAGKLPGVTSIPGNAESTPRKDIATPSKSSENFVPSNETPHLSALMRRRGFDGNLGEMVGEAKKVDEDEDLTEDSDVEKDVTISPNKAGGFDGASDSPLPTMRMPARSGMSPAPFGRPSSSKGPDGNKKSRKLGGNGTTPRLQFASLINTNTLLSQTHSARLLTEDRSASDEDVDNDVTMMDGPSIVDLSPNTVASNNAPSLVSDDGEYDDGDDAESSLGGSEGEDEGSDVAEIDFASEDGEEKVVPRAAPRHGAGNGEGGSMRLRKEEKHVTFVSPIKDAKKERRRKK